MPSLFFVILRFLGFTHVASPALPNVQAEGIGLLRARERGEAGMRRAVSYSGCPSSTATPPRRRINISSSFATPAQNSLARAL
jgi:hypothetical protein